MSWCRGRRRRSRLFDSVFFLCCHSEPEFSIPTALQKASSGRHLPGSESARMYQRALEYPQKIKTFFRRRPGVYASGLSGLCARFRRLEFQPARWPRRRAFCASASAKRRVRSAAKIPRAFLRADHYGADAFMATLKPFAALRPKPELAAQICELPYDVMSSDEARAMAAGNPLSFLHVSKPEIDLPPGTDPYSPEVYAQGPGEFQQAHRRRRAQAGRATVLLSLPADHGAARAGRPVAAASCEEYLSGIIKKHELTRADKEDDRVRHIEALNSQTGPVFLTYRAVAGTGRSSSRRRSPSRRTWISPQGRRAPYVVGRRAMPQDISFIEASSRRFRPSTSPTAIIAARRRPGFPDRASGAGHSGAFPRRDLPAQPDADSALQPRAEGSQRPHAGATCCRSSTACSTSQPSGAAQPDAQTRTRSCSSTANGTR